MDYQPDDNLVASIVTNCLQVMRGYPTQTQMTACYNLTARILMVFTVLGQKKDVEKIVDDFADGLRECIEESYSE